MFQSNYINTKLTPSILNYGLLGLALFGIIFTGAVPVQAQYAQNASPDTTLVSNGPSSGTVNINSNTDIDTVERPLQGARRLVIDLNKTIDNAQLTYRVTPVSQFGDLPQGVNPILAFEVILVNMDYNDASFSIDIEVNSRLQNVRIFTRNSPSIERPIQLIGPSTTNPGFSIYRMQTAIIPQNILVTGDLTTIRTGALDYSTIMGLTFVVTIFLLISATSLRTLTIKDKTKHLR